MSAKTGAMLEVLPEMKPVATFSLPKWVSALSRRVYPVGSG